MVKRKRDIAVQYKSSASSFGRYRLHLAGSYFDFLLKNLYATALRNGRRLNDNRPSFLYGTAEQWETSVPNRFSCNAPRERLWEILSGVTTEKQFLSLLK